MGQISLVIGSYNPNREWLNQALESAQGLFDEIILVDDGSTPPIEGATIRKENGGFWTARNAGIAKAKGEIIASLDDDDYFDREGVMALKEFIQTHPSDIWHFPIQQFGEREGLWGDQPDLPNLMLHDTIPSGSWFKKSVWETVGGYTSIQAEDWAFWCMAQHKGFKFTYFPQVVYYHRMRPGSLSQKLVVNLDAIREQIREACHD